MLSSTLFNLFICDLTSVINNSDTVEPMGAGNKNFNTLLYADNLVLISKDASGLQTLQNNYKFHYSTTQLENVPFYKYLAIGLIFSSYGNFNIAKQELKLKITLRALFQLKARIGSYFRTKPKITILSDSLIKPILAVRCGVLIAKETTQTIIELVYTKFCKMLLGTSKTALNNACRAELGQFPLYHEAVFRSIKFWVKLRSKSAPQLACQVYSEMMKTNLKSGITN